MKKHHNHDETAWMKQQHQQQANQKIYYIDNFNWKSILIDTLFSQFQSHTNHCFHHLSG